MVAPKGNDYNRRHGQRTAKDGRRTPAYNSWRSMKQRCNNPRHPHWDKYGGAGITYEPAWEDFIAFFIDMGHRPPGTELDRRDSSLGYTKENCRWLAQAANRGRWR